jgi:hypothetical protein
MGLRSSIGKVAAAVNQTLFRRTSTNPNTDGSSRYPWIDDIYDFDYKKHRRYRDYRKMMRDPQVKVGMSILQTFFLSRKLIVTPGGDDTLDKEAADFIRNELENEMETPLRQVRKNLYTALPYGFSANEMVYRLRNDGRIGLKGIYGIHRKTLDHRDAFQFNDQGELTGIVQSTDVGMPSADPIPIEKVLLYSYDMEFDDPRGQSMLDEVYKNYYMKNKNLKGLAIFLEKLGSPFLLAKLSKTTADYKKEVGNQFDQIEAGRTNMTMGKEDEVQIMESTHDGSAYLNSIQFHNNTIFRRFFIGTLLLGQDNDQSGSLSQSQSQTEISWLLFDGVHEEIAAAMQKCTDQLCQWNFTGAKNPNISYEKFSEEDILRLLEALQPLIDKMVIDADEEWLDEIVAMIVKKYTNIDIQKETVTESTVVMDSGSVNLSDDESESDMKSTLENIVPAPIGET